MASLALDSAKFVPAFLQLALPRLVVAELEEPKLLSLYHQRLA
ncbi:hypothetical protein D046_1360 [Vibrio parahaemolyticus V-223/04]|nr:hypothetical protein D046_1360 [Vibrio parahaemolyticus V-223/04]